MVEARGLGCKCGWRRERGDHRCVAHDQISSHSRKPIELALRPTIFDGDVAALLIAVFTQSPPKRCHHRRERISRSTIEKPDHGHRRLLRALAVTIERRLDALPDIPTVGEFVPGYEASNWYGVGIPKNTPAEIIDKLNKEINAGLADPKIKARLADLGGTPLVSSPADFGKLIDDETEKWGKVVKFVGIKAD
jgi:hypothetical protein